MTSTKPVSWIPVCRTEDVPEDGGTCVLVEGRQVAIFHLAREGRWYATQNRCPHWGEEALSRGLVGESGGVARVACPFHKRTFSLVDGKCLSGEAVGIDVYPVKIEDQQVWLGIV